MTEVNDMRGLVFEMLSALAYLRSIGRLPEELADSFAKLENAAREALEIREEKLQPMQPVPPVVPPVPPVKPQVVEVFAPSSDLPAYRQCPACGDTMPKIVHLKRRPRGALQCQACGHEYSFPAQWG